MASACSPPAVLALCGLMYAVREGWSRWGAHVLFVLALALLLGPFLVVSYHSTWVPRWGPPIVLPALLASAGVLCLALARKVPAAFVAGLLLLGLCNAHARSFKSEAGPLYHDSFEFSIEADRFTTRLDPTLDDIKYWYDLQETVETSSEPGRTVPLFDNFVSIRRWSLNLFGGMDVPPIDDIQTRHVGNFSRIAVLSCTSRKADYCQRMTERFATLGMPLRLQAERDFHHGDLEFSVVVYEVLKAKDR